MPVTGPAGSSTKLSLPTKCVIEPLWLLPVGGQYRSQEGRFVEIGELAPEVGFEPTT